MSEVDSPQDGFTLYNIFLHSHSYLRYFILIMLVVVIVKSLAGWLGKKPFTNLDDKLSLYLLIFTHLQLVAGLVLYFISPFVQFGSETMKNKDIRYWTVEHGVAMLIVIVLITMARVTAKRMVLPQAKFRRLVIFNTLALLIILVVVAMSGRGIL